MLETNGKYQKTALETVIWSSWGASGVPSLNHQHYKKP